MSHELYYTSAPKGLQPGSQGFCTVACTKGLPAALLENLESLSGYRPLYPPHDPKAAVNPVSFGHSLVSVGGKAYHVLSRICFAGLDYTDRTNKFAHHIALEAHELPAGGPAWLLRQPGFLDVQWNGQVRQLPAGRVPPAGDQPPAVCREWQRLVGDAGWAGAVADSFLKNPDRPVYFLYEPGTDLLPMLGEALALLPAGQRWRVSFSTYLSGSASCLWRGVPRGGDEAAQARRSPGALIIPLGERLPPPPPGPLVEAARTGRTPPPATLLPPTAAAAPTPIARAGGSNHGVVKPPPITVPAMPGPKVSPYSRRAGFAAGLASGLVVSSAAIAALVMLGQVIIPAAGQGPTLAVEVAEVSSQAALTTQTEKPADQKDLERLQARMNGLNKQIEASRTEIEKLRREKIDAEDSLKAKTDELAELSKKTNQPGKDDPDGDALRKKLETANAQIMKQDKEIMAKQVANEKLEKDLGELNTKYNQAQAQSKQLDIVPTTLKLSQGESVKSLAIVPEIKGSYTLDRHPFFLKSEPDGKKLKFKFTGRLIPSGTPRTALAVVELNGNQTPITTIKWEDKDKQNNDLTENIKKEKLQSELEEFLRNHLVKVTTDRGSIHFVSLRGPDTKKQEPLSDNDFMKLAKVKIGFGDDKQFAPWQTKGWNVSIDAQDQLKHRPSPGAQIIIEIDGKYVEIHRQPSN